MTQSDSPDFEFDVSDLEVEGENAPASEQGEGVPASVARSKEQLTEKQDVKSEIAGFEDDGDEALSGFAIDEMPDVSTSSANVAETNSVPEAELDPSPVSRIEPEKQPKPSRELGDDDLGADVFAEMDTDSDVMSFDDVIEDLMEEVEEFEAGGVVDLDEENVSPAGSPSPDGLFQLNDPDDALAHSVAPESAKAEAEQAEAESPAFPSPPIDFEVPADPPEAEKSEATENVPSAQGASGASSHQGESDNRDSTPEAAAPANVPPSARAESTKGVESDASAGAPVPSKSSYAEMEIPADPAPVASEGAPSPVDEGGEGAEVTGSAESTETPDPSEDEARSLDPSMESAEEEAAASNVAEDISSEDASEADDQEPVEGHERVFFSTDDEAETDGDEAHAESQPAAQADRESQETQVGAGPASLEETEEAEPLEASAEQTGETSSVTPEDQGQKISEQPVGSEDAAEEPASDTGTEDLSSIETSTAGAELERSGLEDEDPEEDLNSLVDAAVQDSGDESLEVEPESAGAPDSETSQADVDDTEATSQENAAEEAETSEGLPDVDGFDDTDDEDDLSELIAAAQDGEVAEESGEETGEDSTEEAVTQESVAADEVEDKGASSGAEAAEEAFEERASESSEGEGEADASEAAQGLAVLDEDDPEVGEETEASATLSSQEDSRQIEDDQADSKEGATSGSGAVAAVPTAEDLLKQAGSLLSSENRKPVDEASDLLDGLSEAAGEEEEAVAMPDPATMISEAAGEEEDDEGVVAMPDPMSLLSEAGAEDSKEAESKSGNVADRAGDLPPPPPAPVEIIDEEPPEEDPQPSSEASGAGSDDAIPGLVEVGDEDSNSAGVESDSQLEDPFASEISLEDFDEDLENLDDLDGTGLDDDSFTNDEDMAAAVDGEAVSNAAPKVVEMPKQGLLWRMTHSLAVAAGFALVGLASVLAVWKQQIVEYIEGRDLDGSGLIAEIKEIGAHALSKFDEGGLYRMQWVDSEVRRVSENEIRLYALVGAQLRENLYKPVLESELDEKFRYDESAIMDSLALAHDKYPEEIGNYPKKPWETLYRISAAKDQILPLKVTYGIRRPSKDGEWELSRVKVAGYREELKWPEGEPRYAFGDDAYDVESKEFEELHAGYVRNANAFVASIEQHKSREQSAVVALQRENQRQRERVKMALTEGAYFNGVAILGEDAGEARDIQLVITEVRNEGAFVKGVVTLDGAEMAAEKYFVGDLDFETTLSGREQGVLNLKTVSIEAPGTASAEAPFFDPRTVSRMRLKADGFRLEGDSKDLSFRLTRSL